MQLMPDDRARRSRWATSPRSSPTCTAASSTCARSTTATSTPRGSTSRTARCSRIAAYNAGSGRVAKLRAEAAEKGLDPNVWFNNVELIAARRVGQETVVYVRNIYKYYIAYKLQLETLEARRAAATKLEPTKPEPKKVTAKKAGAKKVEAKKL